MAKALKPHFVRAVSVDSLAVHGLRKLMQDIQQEQQTSRSAPPAAIFVMSMQTGLTSQAVHYDILRIYEEIGLPDTESEFTMQQLSAVVQQAAPKPDDIIVLQLFLADVRRLRLRVNSAEYILTTCSLCD